MSRPAISMPVIPSCLNLLDDERTLTDFLSYCQTQIQRQGEHRIISISQKIDSVDPLGILQAFIESEQTYFYWENPSKQRSILAIGLARDLTIESGNRFQQAQQFIDNCRCQIVQFGDTQIPGSGYRFFSSFTFFPHHKNKHHPFPLGKIFLPQLQISRHDKHCVLVANLNARQQLKNLEQILTTILQNHQFLSSSECMYHQDCTEDIEFNYQNFQTQSFKDAVKSSLNFIQREKLDKIVIAHTLDITQRNNFNVIRSLSNLRHSYPDCYIFATNNDRGEHFIGASPERLVSIQNSQLVTDAIAGTAPRGKTTSEDRHLAKKLFTSGKERREHQAVIQFILDSLRQLGLEPQKAPLQLLQLSNIQHLWTPIYSQLPSYLKPLEIIAQLHPTPAVAGVPRKFACKQIQQYEQFDRSLYASPLGWIDDKGNSEFIVAIRSALIAGNKARFYAGAGIVAGSDPDREIAEVKLKLQFLLKTLV